MRKILGSLFLLIVISLFMSSCFDNFEGIYNNDIRPLAIGNYWIYDIDTTSNIHHLYYCDTMRVVSYENLNGNYAYGISYNNSGILYYNNKNDGHYFFQKFSYDTTFEYRPQLFMKYPINLNETFNGFKCVSLDATFNNYSGCIDMLSLDTNSSMTNYHHYWKPGIGFIGVQYDAHGKHYMDRLKAYFVQ
jgi:hypothetical protein